MELSDPSFPGPPRWRPPILPILLLLGAIAWLGYTERRGWNTEVVDGFKQGLKTARESSRYRPDPLPDPTVDLSGSFAARLPRDVTGLSVSDAGVVMMPQGTENCGVLVIPVAWPAAAPMTAALESLGRRAGEAFKRAGGDFTPGTVRDQGPRAFARGSGKLSGEKLTTETWIERSPRGCLFFLAFAPKADWDKRRHAMVSLATSFERLEPLPLPVEESPAFRAAVPDGWEVRHGEGWMEIRGGTGRRAGLRLERLPGRPDETKPARNLVGELSGMLRTHPALAGFALEQARSLPDPGREIQGGGPAAVLEGILEVTAVTVRGVITLVGNRERGAERLLVIRRCPEEQLPELGYLLTVMERSATCEGTHGPIRVVRAQPWGGHPLLEDWTVVAAPGGDPWAARLSLDLQRRGKLEPWETLPAWTMARDRSGGKAVLANACRRRPDGKLVDGGGAILDPVPAGGSP